jgi:hypothetical protein
MHRVQERLCAICAVLADMKATKLLGLGETVLQTATSLREVEVGASQGYRVLLMWSLFIGMSSYTVLSPEAHHLTPADVARLYAAVHVFGAHFRGVCDHLRRYARQIPICRASLHVAVFDIPAYIPVEPGCSGRAATPRLLGMFWSHRRIPRAAGEGRLRVRN